MIKEIKNVKTIKKGELRMKDDFPPLCSRKFTKLEKNIGL